MKKIILQIVLAALAIFLVYECYESISIPQKFKVIKEQRYAKVIQRLVDIRSAQVAYKDLNKKYANDFDELINFVKNDSIKVVRSIGELTDDQLEAGMTEEKAIKEGLILRDTIRVAAFEHIIKNAQKDGGTFCSDYTIDDIRYVPFTNRKYQFIMGSQIKYSDSGSEIPLFEARVTNSMIFESLPQQFQEFVLEANGEAIRLKKYAGLKVGDIRESNNNVGNWQ